MVRIFGHPAWWLGEQQQKEVGYFIALPWDESIDRLFEIAKLMESEYQERFVRFD